MLTLLTASAHATWLCLYMFRTHRATVFRMFWGLCSETLIVSMSRDQGRTCEMLEEGHLPIWVPVSEIQVVRVPVLVRMKRSR